MIKVTKKLKIFLWTLAILGLVRIALPSIVKVALNNYLESFSPSILAQVSDVDMAIIRGSYTLKGIKAHVKKSDRQFLAVDAVTASLSWKDLLSGQITSNLLIQKAELIYTESLIPAVKEHLATIDVTKEVKEEAKKSLLKIPRLDVVNSSVSTDIFPSLTKEDGTILNSLNARITNLIPSKESQLSPFNLNGEILGTGDLKVEGELDLYAEVPNWTVDSEILHFDMTSLNKFLKEKVPLTFTRGELDLYAEAKSQGGPIVGYLKPFVKSLDVIKEEEEFEGTGHWFVEIISALGNVTMKSDEVMATKIPFTFDEKLEVDTGETISKAITHGFTQEQSRGIENSIGLKQSQEEE